MESTLHSLFWTPHWRQINGQLYTFALPTRKNPLTEWIESRDGLDVVT